MREEKHIDVSGGNVQIGTNGSHQYQYNFYGAEFDLFDSPGQEECFRELLSQWEPLTRKFKAMMECINHKYVIDWKDVTIK